jgi:tetratricopeptide (TPR) repeat protein
MEAIRGNVLKAMGRVHEAVAAHRKALDLYEQTPIRFEACRARINLGGVLMEAQDPDAARRCLEEGLREAEAAGYDRLRAVALSSLATLAYLAGDHVAAEAHALRSNAIARPREYLPIVFRNCYYMWKIAQARNDEAGVRTNERTLRAYVGRIEEQMSEVEAFRSHASGGEA